MAEAFSRILTLEEATLAHLHSVHDSWLTEAVRRWPDFHFTAADGRGFCLAINGESIGHRILALGGTQLSQDDWKGLRQIVAVIVEAGDDPSEPDAPSEFDPLVYCEGDEAARAWRDLHAASGVNLDDDTAQRLAEELGVDLEDEAD
jgi:hypothetical protein